MAVVIGMACLLGAMTAVVIMSSTAVSTSPDPLFTWTEFPGLWSVVSGRLVVDVVMGMIAAATATIASRTWVAVIVVTRVHMATKAKARRVTKVHMVGRVAAIMDGGGSQASQARPQACDGWDDVL